MIQLEDLFTGSELADIEANAAQQNERVDEYVKKAVELRMSMLEDEFTDIDTLIAGVE